MVAPANSMPCSAAHKSRSHPSMGDCFAYALAKRRDQALLFVGNDFALTDLAAALPR